MIISGHELTFAMSIGPDVCGDHKVAVLDEKGRSQSFGSLSIARSEFKYGEII